MSQNALPAEWVDRIFTKLILTYGSDFTARWQGIDLGEVKAQWGHELAHYVSDPEAIGWALQRLPADRPPTVLQFRELCRQAPRKPDAVPELPPSTVDQDAVRRAKEQARKLADVSHCQDPKAWAKRIVARADAGECINPYSLDSARVALGLQKTMGG